uniref:Portal protein n=1 Tax=viral metagenome TaxID=1070528 RepID=A0A6M3K8F0_9ZZZZ
MMRVTPSKSADYMRAKSKPKGWQKQDEYWAFVKEKFDIGVELRRPFERNWLINLAFLMGKQYTFFNSSAHMVQQLKKVPGRRMTVDNKLIPRWRRQVADMIKSEPIMSVVPNTSDDEDVKAARIGDKVLKHWWQNNQMNYKWRTLAGWKFAIGGGFLGDRWNPKAGPIRADEEGNIIYEGDVEVGVWSYFETLFPTTAMGVESHQMMPWHIRMKWRDLPWLASNYKRGEEVTPEAGSAQYMNMATLTGTTEQLGSTKVPGALVLELYVLPCSDFPKGLFVSGANGIILVKQDYPFTDFSLEHFKDLSIPGVFWGKATLQDAIPLQNRWNRITNDIDEYNRTMAKGKLLVPDGANMRVSFDDTHGQVVNYKPVMGIKPEEMTKKGLPTTYQYLAAEVHNSFQDLFSHHEVTRGTNKSDIRSGEMTTILIEQDAQARIPTALSDKESLERLAKRILQRVQLGYAKERMVRISGREGEFEVLPFKGSDLRSNNDVRVALQAGVDDSRAVREQKILSRFQAGLYGDPTDGEVRRHVMNMLDDAVVKDIYADTRLDESVARFENQMLAQGKEVIVNTYDNHGVHMQELNHFRKSMEYQKLKFAKPEQFLQLELIFNSHAQQHGRFLEEQRRQMIQLQMAMGGSGGKKSQRARTGGTAQ